jgi:hypothetical protein
MVNEVAKKKHPVPSEQEMAEIFEVEELESRLEMCFWGIGCNNACNPNACCNGCNINTVCNPGNVGCFEP